VVHHDLSYPPDAAQGLVVRAVPVVDLRPGQLGSGDPELTHEIIPEHADDLRLQGPGQELGDRDQRVIGEADRAPLQERPDAVDPFAA
jgi:hypothetical protein